MEKTYRNLLISYVLNSACQMFSVEKWRRSAVSKPDAVNDYCRTLFKL